MKKTTEEKINFENSEELDQKWAERTSKVKIVKEACIRVAITEDGKVMSSVNISDIEVFFAVMEVLDMGNPEAFEAATSAIRMGKLLQDISNSLNDPAEANGDNTTFS